MSLSAVMLLLVVDCIVHMKQKVHSACSDDNNSHDNVCGAVIMTRVIARVHPVHLMM